MTPSWKGFIHPQTKAQLRQPLCTFCTLCATLSTAGCISQGTDIDVNQNESQIDSVTERGRRGGQQDTNCSHKQRLEMNTQIPSRNWNTSHQYCCCRCCVRGCIGPCATMLSCVGNVSEQISFDYLEKKWLRKQAELWFYSLMLVNDIYNHEFIGHRLRRGRFRGTLTLTTRRQTETAKSFP